MFCAKSHLIRSEYGSSSSNNRRNKNNLITMEHEIYRNLNLAAVNHPARTNSILKSLVDELSFWDVSGSTSKNGSGSCNRRDDKHQSWFAKKKRQHIPSMREATTSHERGNGADRGSIGKRSSQCDDEDDGWDDGHDDQLPSSSDAVWKTAVDPSSGKTYYYDAVTRKTQWDKPAELKALERKRKQERKRRDRTFFDEMEGNVVKSLSRGELIPGIPFKETKDEGSPQEPHPKSRVRTISGMDDMLLAELRDDYSVKRPDQHQLHTFPTGRTSTSPPGKSEIHAFAPVPVASLLEGRPPLPGSRHYRHHAAKKKEDDDDMELSPDIDENVKHRLQKLDSDLEGEKFLDAPTQNECPSLGEELIGVANPPTAGGHTRRNTGGTIYLQNTMTNPDIKATITCVCGVYRAHIVLATSHERTKHRKMSSHEYHVFNDGFGSFSKRNIVTIPSLSEVAEFYEAFYRRSQMEHDTIITSLIYLERVIKSTDGKLTPNPENWRSLLFACMVLASKVWDDLSMWNVDFSNVTAHTAGLSSFTLPRINKLELALLKCLKFDVKVPASEYAKYYFLIRTMLLRSGLVKEEEKPLGKREAFQKLESVTSSYMDQPRGRRAKSMDDSISKVLAKDALMPGPVLKDAVCLEQLVG